ncbi:MAG: cell surface protein SprA [Candidatus Cloacimonetes bacterium 4572_55]|nr:MAG: cell surface protein SprA [Candidatus Cloacimonetes bacterium 4572_55]
MLIYENRIKNQEIKRVCRILLKESVWFFLHFLRKWQEYYNFLVISIETKYFELRVEIINEFFPIDRIERCVIKSKAKLSWCFIILSILTAIYASTGQADPGFRYRPGNWGEPHGFFYAQFNKTTGLSLTPTPIFESRRSGIEWAYEIDPLSNMARYEATVFGASVLVRDSLSLDTFLMYHSRKSIREAWLTELVKFRQQEQGGSRDGFIPEITVPIEMPPIVRNIFGKGEPKLNISGQQRISFEGRSSWNPDRVSSGVERAQSKFPQLKMEQQLTVRLDGTIGDKMHVLVDHNSQSQLDNKNKVRLRYEGYEDDIIQEIESGDTQLGISGGGLVSGSIPHQGLFGIKVKAQLGGVKLTTIASKEEGKLSTARFTGYGSQDSVGVWDYEYAKRQFFWIDDPDFLWIPDPQDPSRLILNENLLPKQDFYVFYDDNNVNEEDVGTSSGIAVARTVRSSQDSVSNLSSDNGFIQMIEGEDYTINFDQGFFRLTRPISDSGTLAISFLNRVDERVGDATGDTLQLRLIRPTQMDTSSGCWDQELRNIYNLGYSFDRNGIFTIKIFQEMLQEGEIDLDYNQSTQEKYIKIIGLDSSPENNKVDDWTLDVIGGYLWIPHHPPGIYPFEVDALDVRNSAIYHKQERDFDTNQGGDKKFYISIISEKPQRQIRLQQLNIIEGSVRIRVNGETWNEGEDYTVNYDFGQVNLSRQLGSSDQIDIDYEYAGLSGLGTQQKTLFGIRAETDIGDNFSIGTTWMYEGEKAVDERPKVGEEASRILVGGVDTGFNFNPPLLTKIVDALPLISTEAQSSVTLSAEAAISLPNPNIKGDGYIDDMEGVVQSTSFGVRRGDWHHCSIPDTTSGKMLSINQFGWYKWFNPANGEGPKLSDIYGDVLEGQTDDEQFVLEMHFQPSKSDTVAADSARHAWAGVQKSVSQTGLDFSEQSFLEVWLYSEFDETGVALKPGHLNIDLGDICEDAVWRTGLSSEDTHPPNDTLDTEDGLTTLDNDVIGPNGKLESGEDRGLDAAWGTDTEPGPAYDEETGNYDDQNDDYPGDKIGSENDYNSININGTENNGQLDTEDLDGNGSLRSHSQTKYIQFTIDLSDTSTGSFYVSGTYNGDSNGAWRKYQIPLTDAAVDTIQNGDSAFKLSEVRYVRMWLSDFEKLASDEVEKGHVVKVYSIDVTGNRWRPSGFVAFEDSCRAFSSNAETFFDVTAKNNKEHSYYEKPPGVPTRRDVSGVAEREQTLALVYKNMKPSTEAKSNQYFTSNVSFLSYGDIRFWASYPEHYVSREDEDDIGELKPADLFIRFGSDTLNYYEYTIDMEEKISNSADLWHEIVISLEELTQVKLRRDQAKEDSLWFDDNRIFPDAYTGSMRIKGRPTLSRVQNISIGVRNVSCGTLISGELWVNELRLSGVKNDIGWTSRFSANIRMADLASINMSLTKENADYTPFSGRASNQNVTSYRVNADLSLHKFLPKSWGFSIPIRGGISRSKTLPRYKFNSDVLLSEEDQENYKSETKENRISASLSKSGGSKNPLIKLLLENLSLSGNYSKRTSYSVAKEDTSISYGGKLDYNLQFGQKRLKLYKGFFIAPLPNNVTFGVTYSGSETRSLSKTSSTAVSDTLKSEQAKGNFSTNFNPIPNLTARFNMSEDRDMTYDGDKKLPGLGINIGVRQSHIKKLDGNYTLNLFNFISPKVNASADYSERHRTQGSSTSQQLNSGSGSISRNVMYGTDASLQPEKIFGLVGKVLSVGKIFTKIGGGGDGEKEEDKEGKEESDPRAPDDLTPEEMESIRQEMKRGGPRGFKEGGDEPDPKIGGDGQDEMPGEIPDDTPNDTPDVVKDKEDKPSDPRQGGRRRDRGDRRDGKSGGGIFSKIKQTVGNFTRTFGSVSGRYSHKQSVTYNEVDQIPDLLFQLGFKGKDTYTALTDSGNTIIVPQSHSISDDYSLSTRVRLSKNLDFDVRYSRNESKQKTGGQSSDVFRTKRDITFPSIGGNLNSLEKLPLLKKIVKRASISSTYKKVKRLDGNVFGESGSLDDVDEEGVEMINNETITNDFSPLISLTTEWKAGFRLTVSSNYSLSKNRTNIRTNENGTESKKLSFDGRIEYTIKAGSGGTTLPIFGRINSDVRLSLQSSWSHEQGWGGLTEDTPDDDREDHKNNDRKTLSFRPSISYSFSRSVTGGLQGEYSSSVNGLQPELGRKTISLNIWTQLKF